MTFKEWKEGVVEEFRFVKRHPEFGFAVFAVFALNIYIIAKEFFKP